MTTPGVDESELAKLFGGDAKKWTKACQEEIGASGFAQWLAVARGMQWLEQAREQKARIEEDETAEETAKIALQCMSEGKNQNAIRVISTWLDKWGEDQERAGNLAEQLVHRSAHNSQLPLWRLMCVEFKSYKSHMITAAQEWNKSSLLSSLHAIAKSNETMTGSQALALSREWFDDETFASDFLAELQDVCEEKGIDEKIVKEAMVGTVKGMLQKEKFVKRQLLNLAALWDWDNIAPVMIKKWEEILDIEEISSTPVRWNFVREMFLENPLMLLQVPEKASAQAEETKYSEEQPTPAQPASPSPHGDLMIDRMVQHAAKENDRKKDQLQTEFGFLVKKDPDAWETLSNLSFIHPLFPDSEKWRQDQIPNGVVPDVTESVLNETMIHSDVSSYNAKKQYDFVEYLAKVVRRGHVMLAEFISIVRSKLKDVPGLDEKSMFIKFGPVKGSERIRVKSENDYSDAPFPTSAQVIDVIRGSITFKDLGSLVKLLTAWIKDFGDKGNDPRFEIIRLKNGFHGIKYGDWPTRYKDVKLNVMITVEHPVTKEPIALLSEIQLLLWPFLDFKRSQHELYEIIRVHDLFRKAKEKLVSTSMANLVQETGDNVKKLGVLLLKHPGMFTEEFFEQDAQLDGSRKRNLVMRLVRNRRGFTKGVGNFFSRLGEHIDLENVWEMVDKKNKQNVVHHAAAGGNRFALYWLANHIPRQLFIQLAKQPDGSGRTPLALVGDKMTTVPADMVFANVTVAPWRFKAALLADHMQRTECGKGARRMAEEVLGEIAKYSKTQMSVRITRPRSAGLQHDLHHLHIRQIELLDFDGKVIPLTFVDASPLMTSGGGFVHPNACIDGSYTTINHNGWHDRSTYGTEDHWMEFRVQRQKTGSFASEVRRVRVLNRSDGCVSRLRGSYIDLVQDGELLRRITVSAVKTEYYWDVLLDAKEVRFRLTRPMSADKSGDMHHLHIRQLQVIDHYGVHLPLEFTGASPLMLSGRNGAVHPVVVVDGVGKTICHNEWQDRSKYGTEDHWFEFAVRIPRDCAPEEIFNRVRILNRDGGCQPRLVGSILEVISEGEVLRRMDIQESHPVYAFPLWDRKIEGQEVVIRLTRPLTAGTDGDMHHLHVRQIAVYDRFSRRVELFFRDASPMMLSGPGHVHPRVAVDGVGNSICHNQWQDRSKYGTEDHWFEVVCIVPPDEDPAERVAQIRVLNREGGCRTRIAGSVLSVSSDEEKVDKLLRTVQDEYVFERIWRRRVDGTEISVRITRPISAGTHRDYHHLHIRQVAIYDKARKKIPLEFKEASGQMLGGPGHVHPSVCVDGIGNQICHNQWQDRSQYAKEDHWMEFFAVIAKGANLVDVVSSLRIWNRTGGCQVRLVGAFVELLQDGEVVLTFPISTNEPEYEFEVDDDDDD